MSKTFENDLHDEILTGPLAADLAAHVAAGEDGVIAEALNAPRYSVPGPVSRARFAIWAATGPRAVIEDLAADANSPFRASALTLKDFLVGATDVLELNDANVAALLAQWHSAGKITTEQHDALMALGARQISRAEQAGIIVTTELVAQALRG